MSEKDYLCSSFSRFHGEALPGTAPQGTIWLLLEYNGLWGPKAFEDSSLPDEVKAKLSGLSKEFSGVKILLIRRPQHEKAHNTAPILTKKPEQPLAFYIAVAHPVDPELYSFPLQRYEDLLDLDLFGLLSGSTFPAHPIKEKIILVCAHGKRDRCCAHYGTQLYEHLTRENYSHAHNCSTWQTSHVGGHRFAANMVCFPHAIFYGRVETEDSAHIVGSYLNNRFVIEKARGRACFSPAVQAAEIYLRQKTGHLELPGLLLENAFESQDEKGLWYIRFSSFLDSQEHQVVLRRTETEVQVFTSCDSHEKEPIIQNEILEYSS